MAKDGSGTFDQPKIGKKLPKGQGDLKTNAQVFGLIGQQVMRINKLTAAIDSGNATLVNTLDTQLNQANNLAGSQLTVLTNIQSILGNIGSSLAPLAAFATEQNEGKVGKGGMMSGIAGFFSPNKQTTAEIDKNTQAVNRLASSYKNLDKQAGRMTGAGLGGGIVGATIGGAIGGLGRAGMMGGAVVGGTLGLLGGGLLMVTGALYVGAKAVETFGEGLIKVDEGMRRLNGLDLTIDKFKQLNLAINAINKDIQAGEALGFNIFSRSNFENLAAGVTTLNNTELDTKVFDDLGAAITSLQTPILGAVGLQIFNATNYQKLKDGVETLADIEVDPMFASRIAEVGKGIGDFTSNSYTFWSGKGGVSVIEKLSEVNLKSFADGINHLNSIKYDDKLQSNLAGAGTAIEKFLDPLTDYFGNDKKGANIITTLAEKNTLKSLAFGLTTLNNMPNKERLKESLTLIGESVKAMLDGFKNAKAAGVMTSLTAEDFTTLVKGMEDLQSLVSKPVDILNDMGEKVGSVRNSEVLKSDFEALGQSLTALMSGLERSKVNSLRKLTGAGSLFDKNALVELEEGIASLNALPAIDTENFEKIGQALYSVVTGSRGKTTAEEFTQMQDSGFWDRSLLVFDNGMNYFASIFKESPLEDAAKGMQLMSATIKSYEEVDEEQLTNFVTGANAIRNVMSTLSDENIAGTSNYEKLNKFIKTISKLDADNLSNISEIADTLGVAVQGQAITERQVNALRTAVVQQVLNTSVIDNSSQTNVTAPSSSKTITYGSGGSASYVPVSVLVSK